MKPAGSSVNINVEHYTYGRWQTHIANSVFSLPKFNLLKISLIKSVHADKLFNIKRDEVSCAISDSALVAIEWWLGEPFACALNKRFHACSGRIGGVCASLTLRSVTRSSGGLGEGAAGSSGRRRIRRRVRRRLSLSVR